MEIMKSTAISFFALLGASGAIASESVQTFNIQPIPFYEYEERIHNADEGENSSVSHIDIVNVDYHDIDLFYRAGSMNAKVTIPAGYYSRSDVSPFTGNVSIDLSDGTKFFPESIRFQSSGSGERIDRCGGGNYLLNIQDLAYHRGSTMYGVYGWGYDCTEGNINRFYFGSGIGGHASSARMTQKEVGSSLRIEIKHYSPSN